MIITVIMLSCFIYSNTKQLEGEKLKVALIQGNFPQTWEYRVKNAKTELYTTYKGLTYEALKYEPDLIIWPEYSIPTDIFKDEKFSREFTDFTKTVNSNLIIGTLKEIDNHSHYDIALIFLKNSKDILNYTSVRPVPYETDTKGYDILETTETPFSKIGILMCYEETQLETARAHVTNGAEFLVALSNNNRFKESNGVFLTSLYSGITAAENGKYLVRATNTGISQVVNPFGKVVSKIQPFSKDILVTEIYLNDKKTFYSKYGYLLLNIFMICLIAVMIKKRISKNGR